MIYNKYCNQDLWCAKSHLLCKRNTLDDKKLELLRQNIGFFALKSPDEARKCNDNHEYYIDFRGGNYLSINSHHIAYSNSKKDVINALSELLSSLYIITKKLNSSCLDKNYSLYEVLVLACKIRHYICIDFISLNSFLEIYRNSIISRISEMINTDIDNIQYNNFPNYIAILHLTRSQKREKAYKSRKVEDDINFDDRIDLTNLPIQAPYKISCHINEMQINNLIKILNNPHKITSRKLNYMRSKQR
jgi:hypothetical protein